MRTGGIMLDCVYGWKVLGSNKILGFIVGSWDLGLGSEDFVVGSGRSQSLDATSHR